MSSGDTASPTHNGAETATQSWDDERGMIELRNNLVHRPLLANEVRYARYVCVCVG